MKAYPTLALCHKTLFYSDSHSPPFAESLKTCSYEPVQMKGTFNQWQVCNKTWARCKFLLGGPAQQQGQQTASSASENQSQRCRRGSYCRGNRISSTLCSCKFEISRQNAENLRSRIKTSMMSDFSTPHNLHAEYLLLDLLKKCSEVFLLLGRCT